MVHEPLTDCRWYRATSPLDEADQAHNWELYRSRSEAEPDIIYERDKGRFKRGSHKESSYDKND